MVRGTIPSSWCSRCPWGRWASPSSGAWSKCSGRMPVTTPASTTRSLFIFTGRRPRTCAVSWRTLTFSIRTARSSGVIRSWRGWRSGRRSPKTGRRAGRQEESRAVNHVERKRVLQKREAVSKHLLQPPEAAVKQPLQPLEARVKQLLQKKEARSKQVLHHCEAKKEIRAYRQADSSQYSQEHDK